MPAPGHCGELSIVAVKWLTRAAEHGDPPAQFSLGVAYGTDRLGVPTNAGEELRWPTASAERGVGLAQRLVGLK